MPTKRTMQKTPAMNFYGHKLIKLFSQVILMSDQAFIQRRSQHPVREEEKVYRYRPDPEAIAVEVYLTNGIDTYKPVELSQDGTFHLKDGLYIIKEHIKPSDVYPYTPKLLRNGHLPSDLIEVVVMKVTNGDAYAVFTMYFPLDENEKEIYKYLDEILPFNSYITL